jgi:hypothetical protein
MDGSLSHQHSHASLDGSQVKLKHKPMSPRTFALSTMAATVRTHIPTAS